MAVDKEPGQLWLECTCGYRSKIPADTLGTMRACVQCGAALVPNRKNTRPVDTGPLVASARPRIGEMLVREGLITKAQLSEALTRHNELGGKTVQHLIDLGYLTPSDFVRFLARRPGTASIDLRHYTIAREVLALVPAAMALEHELIPLDKMGRYLTVAMACPLDERTIAELERMTDLRVRAMLVDMESLHAALRRYYGIDHAYVVRHNPVTKRSEIRTTRHGEEQVVEEARGALPGEGIESADTTDSGGHLDSVAHLVRRLNTLPALPETVNQIRSCMYDAEVTSEKVAVILNRDPALAAHVLRLANSAAFGFVHRVTDVQLAVTLLGLNEIFGAVASAAVIDYFSGSRHFDYRQFWRRAMLCALATRKIAQARGEHNLGSAFASGLLFDLGRLAMAEVAAEQYADVDQTMPEADVITEETRIFGIAHPEVGYILANGWRLPIEIAEPIRYHHDYTLAQYVPERVATVALAAMIADAYGRVNRENVGRLAQQCTGVLKTLSLSVEQFVRVLNETTEAAQQGFLDGNSAHGEAT